MTINLRYTWFTSLPCQLMKFAIRAEFLDTKLLVFTRVVLTTCKAISLEIVSG